MSFTLAELQARNEDRLRFQIQQETSEWKDLKAKLFKLKSEQQDAVSVCISRLNRSKLPHYLTDPIKDEDYPIEIFTKKTKIAQILVLIRKKSDPGRFKSLVIIDNKGRMLTPQTRLESLQAEYQNEMVFLKYTDSNYFG